MKEHNLNTLGKYMGEPGTENIPNQFFHNNDGKYIPRAILTDLEPTMEKNIK
jgi:hypothetical protein